MRRVPLIVILGFFSAFCFFSYFGSATKAQTLKVDVLLQEVTATVTDPDGKLITDLQPEDFIVEVDGTPQRIEHFSHDKDVPLSIGLVLVTSRSMDTTMTALKRAAEAFVLGMHSADEAFLMTFDMNAKVRQGFTHDPARLFDAMQAVPIGGGSAL